jgi:hypothetical protein
MEMFLNIERWEIGDRSDIPRENEWNESAGKPTGTYRTSDIVGGLTGLVAGGDQGTAAEIPMPTHIPQRLLRSIPTQRQQSASTR